jgi:hypothetical protein
MWVLYLTAKATHSRPSDLVEIEDRWTAYQFDSAVTFLGTVIENAAQEQENHGTEKKPDWGPKHQMDELLDPEFRLPRPPTKKERERHHFQAFASQFGIKTIKAG